MGVSVAENKTKNRRQDTNKEPHEAKMQHKGVGDAIAAMNSSGRTEPGASPSRAITTSGAPSPSLPPDAPAPLT